jgi:hypothetical protein
MRNACKVSVGKPDTVKPFVSSSRVVKDVIKWDFKERLSGDCVFSITIVQWAAKLRNIGLIPARDKGFVSYL